MHFLSRYIFIIIIVDVQHNFHYKIMFCFCFFFQEIQTEIVLMIFLRLAEDVITMDSNLQSSRKKEITSELNRLAQELFVFFLETLSTNISKYRVLKVGCKGMYFHTTMSDSFKLLSIIALWKK